MNTGELKRSLIALRGLTRASLKMYFRNRTAIIFSLFFPMMFVVVFGLIFQNSSTSFTIDLTNQSHSQLATQFVQTVEKVPGFKVKQVALNKAQDDLNKGTADLQVIVPPQFGETAQSSGAPVVAHYNEARPQTGQAASLILSQVVNELNYQITKAPPVITVQASGVKTTNLSYIDFLLPGMVALSIMQLGIFSVAFAFVSYKSTGALRRIQAAPTRPGIFLLAQGLTRLVIAVLQTAILAIIGIVFFSFHLSLGSWLPFIVLSLLGSIVFMSFGFMIAGWAKNEDQAAPVANLLQFPMMFLSGIFFPRDSFPAVLKTITDYMPLTYLADALRKVANEGASLWAVRGDMLALGIWGLVMGFIAVRVFRWE